MKLHICFNLLDLDLKQKALFQKIDWLKSLRDVYHRFLQSAQSQSNMGAASDMPYFYVKNQHFAALFKIEDGRPQVVVKPSKELKADIHNCKLI